VTVSLAASLASLPEIERAAVLADLTDSEAQALEWDWSFWGRENQIAPNGDWSTWIALCGRGWGKTEAGAQWIRQRVANGARSIAIVAETQKDLEEVMVPRIVRVHPPKEAPSVRFKPVRLTWPNGAVALGYNGTEPNQLRGPEFDTAWVDELAKYRNAQETWDMLQFTMRRGDPRVFVTTTPRPIPIIKSIIADQTTAVTRGKTFDNAANLPEAFLRKLRERYEGTRLGRQELSAEILDDVVGALWTRAMIDQARAPVVIPDLQRVVVAVDPSGARGADDEGADSQGIVVAGLGVDGRGYVLADRTCKLSPHGWGTRAVNAYYEFAADRIVAERNYGGAMVEAVIRSIDAGVAYREVVATRGKVLRAEPVAALYEQKRISHCGPNLEALEDQMCMLASDGYIGDGSPDRVDALVWAISELMVQEASPSLSFG
jgi:phage terminase large subunit-like protein